jgi:hypothetical protein
MDLRREEELRSMVKWDWFAGWRVRDREGLLTMQVSN